MKSNRLLLIYSGWLGDLVWLIPAIHALRSSFESVSIVVSKVQAELAFILKNGLLDEVFVDEPRRRLAAAAGTRRAASKLGIGVFADFKGQWKTGIHAPWTAGARILIPHPDDAREYILSRLVHPLAEAMPKRSDGHMVDAYLSAVGGLVVGPAPVSFSVPFDERTIENAERVIDREELRSHVSVALNLGSAQYSKIWPPENFKLLAEMLERDMGCKPVIMGARRFEANDDYDLRAAREVFGDGRFTTLVEETDFAVDSYLLRCGAFALSIGNDSYAGHMAGSADEAPAGTGGAAMAPNGRWYKANHTVSLFGPTNPAFCGPYDPTVSFNTIVMPERYPEDCVYDRRSHVCPHYGDRHCRGDSHCMRSITVERVAEAVEKKLSHIRATGTE